MVTETVALVHAKSCQPSIVLNEKRRQFLGIESHIHLTFPLRRGNACENFAKDICVVVTNVEEFQSNAEILENSIITV